MVYFTFLQPMDLSSLSASDVLNINVGVLGHVDSGKTSLGTPLAPHSQQRIANNSLSPQKAKALSTVGSTAAFDKHPQSQERGITLDLGACILRSRRRSTE